jgi:hypothetical protein
LLQATWLSSVARSIKTQQKEDYIKESVQIEGDNHKAHWLIHHLESHQKKIDTLTVDALNT